MKLKKLVEYILYGVGFTTYNSWRDSGITLVSLDDDATLTYMDKNYDEWTATPGSSSASETDTGITIAPSYIYVGDPSGYTQQLTISNMASVNVTSLCSFRSVDTTVATVSAGGLITGVYTGTTKIAVTEADGTVTSSNTFTVGPIVSTLTFRSGATAVTGVTLLTGFTYDSLSVVDQKGNIVVFGSLTSGNTTPTVATATLGSANPFAITALLSGSTTITATEKYGALPTKTLLVTVTDS